MTERTITTLAEDDLAAEREEQQISEAKLLLRRKKEIVKELAKIEKRLTQLDNDADPTPFDMARHGPGDRISIILEREDFENNTRS